MQPRRRETDLLSQGIWATVTGHSGYPDTRGDATRAECAGGFMKRPQGKGLL